MTTRTWVCAVLACCFATVVSAEPPPLSAYGQLPGMDEPVLSPSGKRLAFVATLKDKRRLLVTELGGALLSDNDIGVKIRSLSWAGEDIVLMTASATQSLGLDYGGYRNEFSRVSGTRRAFPNYAVRFQSWNDDFNRFVVFTDGQDDPGTWWLVDITPGKATELGWLYKIPREQVGPYCLVSYKAADGLEQEGVLTLPPGRESRNLPLVVLPHGGPQAHYMGVTGSNYEKLESISPARLHRKPMRRYFSFTARTTRSCR
ncbi:MAG: hypothetical protein ABW034_00580 [Steroidobacteraceae bacterium]